MDLPSGPFLIGSHYPVGSDKLIRPILSHRHIPYLTFISKTYWELATPIPPTPNSFNADLNKVLSSVDIFIVVSFRCLVTICSMVWWNCCLFSCGTSLSYTPGYWYFLISFITSATCDCGIGLTWTVSCVFTFWNMITIFPRAVIKEIFEFCPLK